MAVIVVTEQSGLSPTILKAGPPLKGNPIPPKTPCGMRVQRETNDNWTTFSFFLFPPFERPPSPFSHKRSFGAGFPVKRTAQFQDDKTNMSHNWFLWGLILSFSLLFLFPFLHFLFFFFFFNIFFFFFSLPSCQPPPLSFPFLSVTLCLSMKLTNSTLGAFCLAFLRVMP